MFVSAGLGCFIVGVFLRSCRRGLGIPGRITLGIGGLMLAVAAGAYVIASSTLRNALPESSFESMTVTLNRAFVEGCLTGRNVLTFATIMFIMAMVTLMTTAAFGFGAPRQTTRFRCSRRGLIAMLAVCVTLVPFAISAIYTFAMAPMQVLLLEVARDMTGGLWIFGVSLLSVALAVMFAAVVMPGRKEADFDFMGEPLFES